MKHKWKKPKVTQKDSIINIDNFFKTGSNNVGPNPAQQYLC